MDKLLHNVGDLTSPQRSGVESILGHALRDDQQLFIVAFDRATEPTASSRRQAWSELQEVIQEAHQNVRNSGVSSDELERTIDQACDDVRYGK
jgi:hypothetical protein